ncbi:hypothetical protein Godav_026733 [Gossypium davidsonii]|uniref:RNase H type-1 domain-containing protein n=1 Tax=Gossypium davidsonii TaxID=34287 RepID=A0A7J8RUL9_GOSDV|nr:hypothetical protein [Gossypium davidsonii]
MPRARLRKRSWVRGVTMADMGNKDWIANKWVKVRKKDGLVTTNFIKNYLKELDNLSNKLLERKDVIEQWKKPENLCVKLNFDAAYRNKEKKSCSGIVIRDSKGQMGLDLGIRAMEVEGDSLTVVKKA